MAEEILRTEGLCKRFGSLEVLRGVSISVFRQEIVSVIGPSGSGKSTFLRCLNWLERPTSGKVFFHQQEIPGKRLEICRYRQKIGMIFQNFNVFPNMTVLENITLAPILEKKVPNFFKKIFCPPLTVGCVGCILMVQYMNSYSYIQVWRCRYEKE